MTLNPVFWTSLKTQNRDWYTSRCQRETRLGMDLAFCSKKVVQRSIDGSLHDFFLISSPNTEVIEAIVYRSECLIIIIKQEKLDEPMFIQ